MHLPPIALPLHLLFAGAPVLFGQSEPSAPESGSASTPASDEAPTAPERSIYKLTLPAGFSATLFAAEPLIQHPLALEWDAGRRAWVANTSGALFERKSDPAGPAADSIVVLEDADHDGRADRARTFADGLVGLRSFVLHRDGVIAAQAGSIVELRDADGDGRADARTVLFEGFGADTVVADLSRGLDGFIYASHRNAGGFSSAVRDGGERKQAALAGGVIRFRPDGTQLELVSRSDAALGGFDIDADGELFFSTSFGGLRHVVMKEGLLARGRIGSTSSWADLGGGALGRVLDPSAPAGASAPGSPGSPGMGSTTSLTGDVFVGVGSLLYAGASWPSDYDGNYFTWDPVGGSVRRNTLRPKGVSFVAAPDAKPFLISSDRWFRPVHAGTGPDGAMYVLDYCQETQESRRGYGRIYRVDNVGSAPLPTVTLEGAETSLLIAALEHPGFWHRNTAQRLLTERSLDDGELGLILNKAQNSLEGYGRIHMLWALSATSPRLMQKLCEGLLRDFRPNVRINALHAAALADDWDVLRLRRTTVSLLGDASPHVRLAALGAIPGAFGKKMRNELLQMYRRSQDDWTRSAIFAISAETTVDFVESAFANGDTKLDGLVQALVARVGDRGDIKSAVGIVVAADRFHDKTPRMAAAALNVLNARLHPDLKPWSSPTMRSTLRSLLRSGSVEVAFAALPFAERWIRSGELSPDIEGLALRVRDTVANLDAASRVTRPFLEGLTEHPDENIARKARQRLRELDNQAGE